MKQLLKLFQFLVRCVWCVKVREGEVHVTAKGKRADAGSQLRTALAESIAMGKFAAANGCGRLRCCLCSAMLCYALLF